MDFSVFSDPKVWKGTFTFFTFDDKRHDHKQANIKTETEKTEFFKNNLELNKQFHLQSSFLKQVMHQIVCYISKEKIIFKSISMMVSLGFCVWIERYFEVLFFNPLTLSFFEAALP
jgi:CRISPR/Cas system CMR subunit Cmr6 (Cas7 group RAMP superfamily)